VDQVQVVLDQLKLQSPLTKLWLLVLLLLPARTIAVPIVPQFRSGSSSTSSTTESVINETITSHQYRTGYSYSASGHNIESADTNKYINPTATTLTEQTVGGVNFSWTSPNLEAVPRWTIVNPAGAFSLQETLITPGLDTVTTITRTINTSTTTETTTTFGQ
jgi:hypothetical protein